MENRTQTHGSEWPYFDLSQTLNNAKFSKKVFLVDGYRNGATLRAVRLAALSQRDNFSAGFSILDLIHSIPPLIQVDPYYLEGTRRQAQHFNRAPAWRHCKPELKAIFYQLAMLQQAAQSACQLIPFTLDLTPKFVHRAFQHKAGFIDYTKREIDKAMKSELDRKPQYWFTVEMATVFGSPTSGRQRPHLHASILLNDSETESKRKQKTPISRAFHKAVGKCPPDFSNRLLHLGNHRAYAEQVGISEIEAVINWPGYCLKLNTTARLHLKSKTNLTADNVTKRQAEALYGLLTPK
ncbi:hypothetical protein [Methylomicrobium agile]|uniref:hypothetical protein n=1 Tax=Methylomicrobium agile TaxID=39774 RepID=UPI0004DF6E54|nr:hypothetical protein [Methylomicrobium agile]